MNSGSEVKSRTCLATAPLTVYFKLLICFLVKTCLCAEEVSDLTDFHFNSIQDPLMDTSPITTPSSISQASSKTAQALPHIPLVSTPSSTENMPLPPTTNQMVLQSPTTPAATPTQMPLLHPSTYPAMATLIHFAGDSMSQSQLLQGSKPHLQGQNQMVAMTTVASQQQLIQAAASQLQSSYAGMPVPIQAFSMPLPAGIADASQHMSSTGVPHIAMTPVPISAYSLATPLQPVTTATSAVTAAVNTVAPPLPMVNLNAGIAMPQMQGMHQHAVPTSVLPQNGTIDDSEDDEEEEEEEEELEEEEEEEDMEDDELENEEEENEGTEEKDVSLEQASLVKPKGEVKIEKVPNQVLSCCVQPAACEVTIESVTSQSPSISPSKVEVQVEVEVTASESVNSAKKISLTNGNIELRRDLMRNQQSAPSNGITKK